MSKLDGEEWAGLGTGTKVSTDTDSLAGAGLEGPLAAKVVLVPSYNH